MGFLKLIVGAVAIAGGIMAGMVGALNVAAMLITAGAGMTLSGIGTLLSGNVKGFATTTRNSIAPWRVCYGRCRVGGTVVYMHSWGSNDQMLDLVIVLAAHQCQSIDMLLFDQQPVFIDTAAVPPGVAPNSNSGTSFTPVQQTVNITSISRANDVVTVVLAANIPYLAAGYQIQIQNITGDYTLNGTFQVAEVLSQTFGAPGSITFTYLSGGQPSQVNNEGQAKTLWPDYGRDVYMEALLGDQELGETFAGMMYGTPWQGDKGNLVDPRFPGNAGGPTQNNPWTQYCSLQGKTAVFLRLKYSTHFPQGLPQISFLIHGKNDILDVRTNTQGYTENAALCIADFLSNTTFGFKCKYGTDIPTQPLVNAANICDQRSPLAIGGTEPLYTCNGSFELTMRRGEILQNLLTSCAGRLTYVSGQYTIWPGAWYGSSPAAVNLMQIAAGPFRWRPTVSIRDLYNAVKGTYISPANKWMSTDFPYYAQDAMHGYDPDNKYPQYGGDINLAADGGDRRWLDIQLPFTISTSMAQRIAKIELLRRRNQGTGTFPLNMAGYQFTPMDVIAATHPFLGWNGKILEVADARFRFDKQSNGRQDVIRLGTEIDVQETDSDIYAWSIEEELSPQGYVQTKYPAATVVETVPLPWSPGYVAPLAGDAVYPQGAQGPGTFGLQPLYTTDSQNNAQGNLQIKGAPPINVLDEISAPYVTAAGSAAGGSLPAGTYVIGVSAFDSGDPGYKNTPYLDWATVMVPAGGAGSITVTIEWGSGDDGGDLYIAAWRPDGQYQFHWNQTLSPGTTSATVTTFDQSQPGGPDAMFDHFSVILQECIHNGNWSQQVQAVTANAITIAGSGMTANQWKGYTLSLLAKIDPTKEIPVLNMPVASSTASSGGQFILTIGQNSAGQQLPDLTTLLEVGDLVTMRFYGTFAPNGFSDPNMANAYYPQGASGVEAGHVAVVLSGADAGDVQTIAGMGKDSNGNYTQVVLAGTWAVTPAPGDLVIICASGRPQLPTSSFTIPDKNAFNGVVATPSITNQIGQSSTSAGLSSGWLVLVRTEDASGNYGDDAAAPMRDIYFFGPTNTLPLAEMTISGTLAIKSSAAPSVYFPAATTVNSIAGYVKQAPEGDNLQLAILVGGQGWAILNILNGTASAVQLMRGPGISAPGSAPAVIPANTEVRLDVIGVGTTFPGSDLSLFFYR